MFLSFLKRLIPTALKRPIKRVLGLPERRLHTDWQLLERIGPVAGPHVVIDVGAHHGWFFHCWRDWCPGAIVHAFEPTPVSYARCKELYGSEQNTFLIEAAVGSTAGSAELHLLAESEVSNSLLVPRAATWDALEYRTGSIEKVAVRILTLDEYLSSCDLEEIFLLKIDVQGFEMEVLKGAEASLSRIDYIFVESGIRPLYEGGARFSEVFDYLIAHGFHLIGQRAWHTGDFALVEADLLFRRNELLPRVEPQTERIYESI
ncbi:MAG: FkbM family methyltransferase [Thermoanaerobaculia bacterium]